MKNTVYGMARQHPIDHVETFGSALAEHFLLEAVGLACADQRDRAPWGRLSCAGTRTRMRSSRAAGSMGRRW